MHPWQSTVTGTDLHVEVWLLALHEAIPELRKRQPGSPDSKTQIVGESSEKLTNSVGNRRSPSPIVERFQLGARERTRTSTPFGAGT